MGARMPEKDQDGFVITEITPDREAGAEGESAENRAQEPADGPVKAVLSPGSKAKVKPNGELEAERGCQGVEMCFRTKRVARAPFLIGVDSRAGSVEGWSCSFHMRINQAPLFIRVLHKRRVERGQRSAYR